MTPNIRQIEDLMISCSAPMGSVFQVAVTFIVSLALAFKTCWSLTLVILASLPAVIGVVTFVAPRMQRNINLEKTHLSHAASNLIRAITAITTVKAFNAQAHEILRFDTICNLASTAYFRLAQINGLQQGIVRFVVLSMFVQGFWYGGLLVLNGHLQPGSVITVFWAALMAVSSLQIISPQMIILEKGKAASAELALLCPSGKQKPSRPMLDSARVGDIELKNVSLFLSKLSLTKGFLRIPRPT
jgi:ATP-binding cassette, subfamily B (MDR/TAP), member 1